MVKHVPGKYATTVFVCDHCGERITDAKRGLLLNDPDDKVLHAHEGDCVRALTQWAVWPLENFICLLKSLGLAEEFDGELVSLGLDRELPKHIQ